MSLTNEVEINLDGETYTLRPTLKAASAVSREYGGFVGAFQALTMLNLQVAQFIVRTGLTSKNISTEDLNEAVWRTGVGKLTAPLSRYVSILQNGGRDPDEVEDESSAEGHSGNE